MGEKPQKADPRLMYTEQRGLLPSLNLPHRKKADSEPERGPCRCGPDCCCRKER